MAEPVVRKTNSTLYAEIQSLLGSSLSEVETIFNDELSSRSAFVRDVLQHLMQYRGKRLRPVLLLLSALATGHRITHGHKVLAAVVEMIHTATLVHDDVLDDADTRRHVPTVNARWNVETSVLLGDFLFTHAFHLTSSLGSAEACRLIGHATNLVCEGEMSQIAERGDYDLSEEQYLEIIEGKTAELCAVSCYLGARWSEASDATCEALDAFGRSLGIAFQIADDLLDVLGNEDETGKSLGSDLEKQKLTLPLIHLLSQASAADRLEIERILAQPTRNTRRELSPWLERYNAIGYARNRANEFIVAARQNLATLPESHARQLLEDVADFALGRSH